METESSNNKELMITPESRIIDIQFMFNELYPYLKIDFYKPSVSDTKARKIKIESNTTFKQFNVIKDSYNIELTPSRKISEIQGDFKTLTGADIQISRKCGNVWNAITITGNWTLQNQNSAGEFISIVMFSEAGL